MSFVYYRAGESPCGEEIPVLALEGRVTAERFVGALQLVDEINDDSSDDGEPLLLLFDLRAAEFHARTDELQRLVARLGNSPIERFALVVERDVDFGIGRMLETFAELQSIEARVFRDPSLASRWLRERVAG